MLRFYNIKEEYVEYLRKTDKLVLYNKNEERPYAGIVLTINEFNYYVPLASPKEKHKNMHNDIDFRKIAGGRYGALNFNNMIPVPSDQIIELDINKEKDLSYRYLLQAESREVNRQKKRIRKNAEIVYSHKIHSGNSTSLAKRTNDFEMLEKLCRNFNKY